MNISNLDEGRKRAILNAALKEFTTKGYEDASTNIIAKEAGISKALMFHYVGNKQELFQFIYNYFKDVLETEYYSKLDFNEPDLFNRLRQSYLLQIELLKQYPAILNFDRLSDSDDELQNIKSCPQLFENIDYSKYRKDLDIEKCQQFILRSNIGFTTQILETIKDTGADNVDYEQIIATLDGYFNELRKVFYDSSEEF